MKKRMLLLIASVLLYSCGESEAEILDTILGGDDGVLPQTTLITSSVNPLNSTVTFNWMGNESALMISLIL